MSDDALMLDHFMRLYGDYSRVRPSDVLYDRLRVFIGRPKI